MIAPNEMRLRIVADVEAMHDEIVRLRGEAAAQLEKMRARIAEIRGEAAAQLEKMRARVAEMERERDEARAENARYRGEELAVLAKIYGAIENERGIFHTILDLAKQQASQLADAREALERTVTEQCDEPGNDGPPPCSCCRGHERIARAALAKIGGQ